MNHRINGVCLIYEIHIWKANERINNPKLYNDPEWKTSFLLVGILVRIGRAFTPIAQALNFWVYLASIPSFQKEFFDIVKCRKC